MFYSSSQPVVLKVDWSTKFCCSKEAKISAWNLLEHVSYRKLGFSTKYLDGTKPGKGKCLARKAR